MKHFLKYFAGVNLAVNLVNLIPSYRNSNNSNNNNYNKMILLLLFSDDVIIIINIFLYNYLT